MKPGILYYVLFFFLVGLSFEVSAQKNPQNLITGNFHDLTIEQFTQELESQTGYYFYYDISQFDSFRVNMYVEKAPLSTVMERAFSNTDFHFAIDRHMQVFLTSKAIVQTNLNANLPDTGMRKQFEMSYAEADNGEGHNKGIQKATLENKLYAIGDNTKNNALPAAVIAGFVRDAKTGEPVAGASVYIDHPRIGVSSDQYGYYAISLPKGRHVLNIQSIGMKDTRRQVLLAGDGKLNIDMQGQVMMLKNVIISAQKLSNVKGMQMGVQKIDIKTIKQVPVVFGEADLLRVVLTLPGVKSVGEASTGLNVRGGAADQNLILFNEATIFNPSHFFGLFSAFNPEVVKDVQLYKSSIPARYGGRLSSVLDISSREGNKKNITGSAGIGLLTTRLDVEGPLIKDKSSFILGGRTTYANWLLNLLPAQYKNSKASFYDLNLNVTHQFNRKNSLYLTGYTSGDHFNLNSDTTYGYNNLNLSLKWKHIFNDKFYGVFTSGYDRYQYNISSEANPVNAYRLMFDINQKYLKAHFSYILSASHALEFGLNTINYKLDPGSYQPIGKSSLVTPDVVAAEHAEESALYLSDRYTLSSRFSVEAGLRYSLFNYLGPQSVNQYAPGLPKTVDNIVSTQSYGKGDFIKNYSGPEYRVSVKYEISDSFSIKAGFNTQRQYIHVLSNTTAIAPTDIWKLSDPNIRPQAGGQVSLGLYKNFKANTIETSIEVYYKEIQHYLDYKSGALLVMNHHVETDVINTRGKAYGVELLIKKNSGKLNGWISYTYSRTFLQADDPTAGEIINGGRYYPANYDQPHSATTIVNYRVNHRFSVSMNATYSTGRPITLPIGLFYYDNAFRTLYANRNAYRIPDYFRTDLSMNIEGNHKVHQLTHNSWTIGVYNVTGRRNPYSVYYVSENGAVNGYKLSIFGSAIPYVNYNIRF
ncbi:MAG: TonB-dependent receptor [Bacteroidota bacterium]|nr:TonB-dependent receptor [Bacteroidota bacterium]